MATMLNTMIETWGLYNLLSDSYNNNALTVFNFRYR